jgi:galactosylceramidase
MLPPRTPRLAYPGLVALELLLLLFLPLSVVAVDRSQLQADPNAAVRRGDSSFAIQPGTHHFEVARNHPQHAAVAAAACDNTTFPQDLNGHRVKGLHKSVKHHCCSSEVQCRQTCCDEGAACEVYQYLNRTDLPIYERCFIGALGAEVPTPLPGVLSRSRGVAPPPPTPGPTPMPPPPTPPTPTPPTPTPTPGPTPLPPSPPGRYSLDSVHGLGLRWEGVGAISGGGATTKLLMDYEPTVASDILDYLFLPNFGLNLQMLKVELGGDSDATEGAEPSHMHSSNPEEADYTRGYEWWLMKEAKRRNPDIKLYGLPWAWPGWLDPNSTSDRPSVGIGLNPFTDPAMTANYTLQWLLGAKREHNLTIDYIGQWNEHDAPGDYADALRAAIAASSLRTETTVLNRLPHYPGTGSAAPKLGCTDKVWNSTDGRYWVDEEGSTSDGNSARCLARCVSRNYVTSCFTATFQWHLISSFYDFLTYKRCGVAVANSPWSGSYEITSPTWALAHTSQFAPIGWRYARHDGGVGLLPSGGSYVTRVSPDMQDFSIVIEKMSYKNSYCARGRNPRVVNATTAENATFVLKGAFLAAATRVGKLQVWYSNLAPAVAHEPDPNELFLQKMPVTVDPADGTFTVFVQPSEIFTITTLTTGRKGNHTIPPAQGMQLPYLQNFENETLHAPPRIWYDQQGAWEIHDSGDATRGKVMRQMVNIWPVGWHGEGPQMHGPTTYFGPGDPKSTFVKPGVKIAFAIFLEDDAELSMVVGEPAGKGNPNPSKNLKLSIDSISGNWTCGAVTGTGAQFTKNVWHNISLAMHTSGGEREEGGGGDERAAADARGAPGCAAELSLNGVVLGSDAKCSIGSFELALSRYVYAMLDDFFVETAAVAGVAEYSRNARLHGRH